MNAEEFKKEKESLVKQYEEHRDRTNQVLGAIMWINQQLEKSVPVPEPPKETPHGG